MRQNRSVTMGGSWMGANASTNFNFSKSVALNTGITDSSSTSVTRSASSTVSIPPKTSGRFEIIAYETTMEIPYSANVIIDGNLVENESGVILASSILNEKERTLPFKGVLNITNVSNASIRTFPNSKTNVCTAAEKVLILTTSSTRSLPGSTIPSTIRSKFIPLKDFYAESKDKNSSKAIIEIRNEPTIGPRDGISYEIVSIADTSKPAPWCGFNDLGIMKIGTFSVETRRFTQYANGTLVATWVNTVETFKSCWPM